MAKKAKLATRNISNGVPAVTDDGKPYGVFDKVSNARVYPGDGLPKSEAVRLASGLLRLAVVRALA
jgi:hypothetical protein